MLKLTIDIYQLSEVDFIPSFMEYFGEAMEHMTFRVHDIWANERIALRMASNFSI